MTILTFKLGDRCRVCTMSEGSSDESSYDDSYRTHEDGRLVRGEGAALPHGAPDTKTHFALPLCHVLFTTSRSPLQTQSSQEIRLHFPSITIGLIINLVVHKCALQL